ncbi:hypothetical protein ACFXOD_11750 [Streptomyces sp. NPDC059161]|uniref:hypothetical protein n=1 Tax=Streptomyces sp. NPDC059161 TaxID=3346749 RepID=UPI003696DAA8
MNTAKLLAHTSLAAGVVFTATAEYSLARRLGAMDAVAVMLPVAIDAYAIAALKRFRSFDITLSLLLMGAAQVSAHLLDSNVMPVNSWLVVVVSLLVPTAIWRTHALARDEDGADTKGVHSVKSIPAEYDVEREQVPVPVAVPGAYPARGVRVPAVPEAVPAGVRLLPIVARPEAPRHEIRDEIPVGVPAAEDARTRAEVHAEYVPDPPDNDVPEDDENPLDAVGVAWAAEQFKDELLAGKIPGIARIKSECRVGQDRAKEIQDAFREALPKLVVAGVSS